MLLWEGACLVHEAFSMEKLIHLWKSFPKAKLIAHPESEEHILKIAQFVGSTSAMLRYVQEDPHGEFIVATEAGILHQMQKRVPQKTLLPAPTHENNTCACSECHFMKKNTLENLYSCLLKEQPEIILEENVQKAALKPILKMLSLS